MFSEVYSDSQRADRILASIRREEGRSGRGLLKIFFGMAPGVGKTYAMLEAAIQAADKGVEVLIGVAESHRREETMRLIGRLPRLPMKKVVYRSVEMEEFDLEEALRLKPRLILVDELAHTNAPGMRHRKRYQDVQELLAAGIDVYTTLNVQHLESRADTVHDITAAPVQETVPDSVLAGADCIQLVDISPDQSFTSARYFWPRLSAGDYAAMPSGASNLSWTSGELVRTVAERKAALLKAHNLLEETPVPADMLFASGSGLESFISPEAAEFQLNRVASARGVPPEKIRELVAEHFVPGSILGENVINVMTLNAALDTLPPVSGM